MKKLIIPSIFIAAVLLSCQKTAENNAPVCCVKEKPVAADTAAAGATGGASIYQLSGKWEDQDNNLVSLAELHGKVQVVAMIFTHCGYACPRIVDNMKTIAAQLPVAVRNKVGFVLISFDPARDSARQLEAFAAAKQLDGHWTLLHGAPDQVRELSMLLDLQYDRLPDGNFSHSNVITILDKQGAIANRIEGLSINTGNAAAVISALGN